MWILFFSIGMGGATLTLIALVLYGIVTGIGGLSNFPQWPFYIAFGFFCLAMAMVAGKVMHELRKP